ncbi:MAG: pal [Francisellaceae bacterium]|nr:pal [Francisellaceae bacterium]
MASVSLMACGAKGKMGRDSVVGGVGDPVQFYGQEVSPEQERELIDQKTYQFAYDRFDVQESDLLSVYAHAKKLMTHPKARMRIEGHTDERGSREYNVALGERRAKSLANIMMLKGVNQDQISIVSFGKERPKSRGHNESAWSENRRAEVVYESE